MSNQPPSSSQSARDPSPGVQGSVQGAKFGQASKGVSGAKPIAQHAQTDLKALIGEQSVELLKALHILTRDGQLNQDSRRKLKQVNHLVQLLEGPLRELAHAAAEQENRPLSLVDHGAGKSYLGFILYDRFGAKREQPKVLALKEAKDPKEPKDPKDHNTSAACSQSDGPKGAMSLEVIAIESRSDLVERSVELAKAFGFTGMQFFNVKAQNAGALREIPERVDVVTALHACDSLSDDAIEFALTKEAKLIFLVPCCQAEAASVLKSKRGLLLNKTPLAELWRHPLHTRELGSQLTNVLRCLYLEAMGYSVSVTELVGWEHSMKNELIVAKYTGHQKSQAAERLLDLMGQFGLESMMETRFARVLLKA